MRLLISFLMLLFPLVVFSQEMVTWVDSTYHDFGVLKKDQEERTEFRFRNDGKEPLVIELVRTTCGCTAPSWTQQPISPDSIGVVTLEYDSRRLGYFRKKAKVFFEGIRKGETLEVEGEVVE